MLRITGYIKEINTQTKTYKIINEKTLKEVHIKYRRKLRRLKFGSFIDFDCIKLGYDLMYYDENVLNLMVNDDKQLLHGHLINFDEKLIYKLFVDDVKSVCDDIKTMCDNDNLNEAIYQLSNYCFNDDKIIEDNNRQTLVDEGFDLLLLLKITSLWKGDCLNYIQFKLLGLTDNEQKTLYYNNITLYDFINNPYFYYKIDLNKCDQVMTFNNKHFNCIERRCGIIVREIWYEIKNKGHIAININKLPKDYINYKDLLIDLYKLIFVGDVVYFKWMYTMLIEVSKYIKNNNISIILTMDNDKVIDLLRDKYKDVKCKVVNYTGTNVDMSLMELFEYLNDNYLDVIIITQSNMLTLKLIVKLIKLVKKIVLVGDNNNITSYKYGSIFNTLIKYVPTTNIINNINNITKNAINIIKDFWYNPIYDESFMIYIGNIQTINNIFIKIVKENGNIKHFKIITPFNVDVMEINQCITKVYIDKDYKLFNIRYNNKLSCVKINIGTLIVNHLGQEGHVVDFINIDSQEYICCTINKIKQQFKIYPNDNIYEIETIKNISIIQPSYAITVHKAIFNQWNTIILYLPSHKGTFINKNLLYSAITSAKKCCLIIEEQSGLFESLTHQKSSTHTFTLPNI